jgi:lysophospholipase L1-like esterase
MRSGVAGVAALLFCCFLARADTNYPTFDQVPSVYGQNLQQFRVLFDSAHGRTVRLGLFGDSQETMPGGAGNNYVARLGAELFKVYGNVPETQLSLSTAYGDQPGTAAFLLGGHTLNAAPARVASSRIPAGLTLSSFRDRSTDTFPLIASLRPDAANAAGSLPAGTYFKSGSSIQAQIFAATNATSGEVHYEYAPSSGPNVNYFAPVASSGTTNLGLASPVPAIKSTTVTLPAVSGSPYPQLIVSGSDPSVSTDIVGVRYRSTVDTSGVVVDSLSAGGYTTSSYVANHGQSGPVVAALGFDAAILHYGTNDAASRSAEQFKSEQLALIQWIRDAVGDPQFKIVLAGDPYTTHLNTAQMAQFNQFAGAQQSIADLDPNVLVLNSRRMTEEMGWSANGTPDNYMVDGVHYSDAGAVLLASKEVAALVSVPEPSGVVGAAVLIVAQLCRRRRRATSLG